MISEIKIINKQNYGRFEKLKAYFTEFAECVNGYVHEIKDGPEHETSTICVVVPSFVVGERLEEFAETIKLADSISISAIGRDMRVIIVACVYGTWEAITNE